MNQLFSAAVAFIFLHRVISGSQVRQIIVERTGERVFQRLFALASLGCLVWLSLSYRYALHTPSNIDLFATNPASRWLQWPLQYFALLMIVIGISKTNPTAVGMQNAVHDDVVNGFLRITRHPFLWGVSLMSAGHIMVLADLASWSFFGTLLFLATTGTISIDRKRSRSLGPDWAKFATRTSNLPFAAILSGRQKLVLGEIGWTRSIFTMLLYVLSIAIHMLTLSA